MAWASGDTVTSSALNFRGGNFYNVRDPDFGATGDGTTNDSVSIQSAIDAAASAGGGTVLFPDGTYVSNVTIREGVVLLGGRHNVSPAEGRRVRMSAGTAGSIIDSPTTETKSVAVIGIELEGLGSGTSCVGIRGRNITRGFFSELAFNSFSDQGLLIEDGLINTVDDIIATQCLLGRTRTQKVGAIELHGGDYQVRSVEAGNSQTSLSDSNAYLCGIAFINSAGGGNHFVQACVGENSDIGIHVDVAGGLCRFSDCRADINFSHGIEILTGNNQFVNCLALRNSRDSTASHDGFFTGDASSLNVFSNCRSAILSSDTFVHRHGFTDQFVSDSSLKNRYVDCISSGHSVSAFSTGGNNGPAIDYPSNPFQSFTDGDATPTVEQSKWFRTTNTSLTTVLQFDDGVPGQYIGVFAGDSNTALSNGTIRVSNLASKRLVQNRIYTFYLWNDVWNEVTADPPSLQASATFNPGSIAAGEMEATEITVTNANVGDFAVASFTEDIVDLTLSADVTAANTVTCVFANSTTGAIDLGSGTLRVKVIR